MTLCEYTISFETGNDKSLDKTLNSSILETPLTRFEGSDLQDVGGDTFQK